jgi:hypothetical protein
VLGAVYGATNVSVEKVIGAEGESQTYETALFARRPAEKIRIEWSNSTNKVASDVDVFGSKWIGPGGIHVGSTIAEVGNANGRPFTFSSLGWDYGGQVRDWRGGALGPVKPTRRAGKFAARLPSRRATRCRLQNAGGRNLGSERRTGHSVRRPKSHRGQDRRHQDHVLLWRLLRRLPLQKRQHGAGICAEPNPNRGNEPARVVT